MAILDRLFPRRPRSDALAGQPVRVVTGVKMFSETPGVIWARPTSSAGVAVDEYEALTIAAVFAACYRLANVAAMLPIGVYAKEANGRRKEQPIHPASRLLNIESNPGQTAFTARWFMQFWKPLFGSASAEIGWDGAGRSRALWPLEPWRVCPEYDQNNQLYFLVDGRRKVAPADMIYVPHVTEDGVTGKGFLHYAIESLGQAIAADRSAGRFFQNDMQPGGILEHPGNPNKEARRQLQEEWKLAHGGIENRGKVGVIWGGWKWIKDTGMVDPDKAQLLESRQFSVTEVARWLNVPPHWIADLSRSTFSNIEMQSIEALIYTVQPMLTAQEQEYDRKLLNPPGTYCKHNVNALLRSDMKTRGEFYRLMRELGAYNANQILDLEDENGIGAEGDRRFVPVNWQPADDLMTGGEAQRKAAEAKQPPVQPPANPVPTPGNSPATPAKTSPTPAMRDALQAVAEHALAGLARKEMNEARRAAKKPNDMTKWMDSFYPDFESSMSTGLLATTQLVLAMCGKPIAESTAAQLAGIWAADWITASRNDLLAAMECKPEEWPNRSAALFLSWEGRPADVAARVGGCLDGE